MSASSARVVSALIAGDIIKDPEHEEPIIVHSVETEDEFVFVYGRLVGSDNGTKVELIYAKGHEAEVYA